MTLKAQQRLCHHIYEVFSIETYGPISHAMEKIYKRCKKCLKTISYDRYRRSHEHENSHNGNDESTSTASKTRLFR